MGSSNLQPRTRIGAMNRGRLRLIRPACSAGHLLPRRAAEKAPPERRFMESKHLQKMDVNRGHELLLLCSAGFPTGDADWKVGVTGSRFMERFNLLRRTRIGAMNRGLLPLIRPAWSAGHLLPQSRGRRPSGGGMERRDLQNGRELEP